MPTYLALGFYWASLPEEEAFAALLAALERRRVFVGTRALVAPARPFGMLFDQEYEQVEWDPELLRADDGRRVIEVRIGDPLGGRKRPEAMVRYVGISDEAAATDHHPIAIMIDADRAAAPGRRFARLLCDLAAELHPSYAAITLEWPLACPADLRRDSRSSAFDDFFVSEAFAGPAGFADIRRLYEDAYTEDVGNGAYFSTTPDWNPRRRSAEAADRSTRVAQIIARRR